MSDVLVIASGAVSAFGLGAAATPAGAVGEAARTCVAVDPFLAESGLRRPNLARAPRELGVEPSADRATDLLCAALRQLCEQLDEVLPRWRRRRVGVAMGTSSGGMIAAERLFAARAAGRDPGGVEGATYFAPLRDALAAFDLLGAVKLVQVLAACASSTIAIGLGKRWLERDACDLVLAGGYDAVSLFVAAGFEALRATTASLPQPFRRSRDGMALGEGAGVVALVREEDSAPGVAQFRISGFGAAADAVHITAPDREARGLIRAGAAALRDAGCQPEQIDLVSAHGTATPYNDAMEAKAVAALCPGPQPPVVHPFKAQIGHTLGAAGVLELLAAADGMRRGILPAAYGDGELDPDAAVRLLPRTVAGETRAVLKLSAAFGGVTAALVATAQSQPGAAAGRRPPRLVWVSDHATVDDVDRSRLAAVTGWPPDRLARIDDLGLLALGAVAALSDKVGRPRLDGAGVVGGYGLATLDTNERFNERLLRKGARWVDPRLFPATTPNAGPGHCAIAFGLTGPCFAVSSGLRGALEALLAAAELVAAGDADRMVVVAADAHGPAARQWLQLVAPERAAARGAVAVLLDSSAPATADPIMVDLDTPLSHDGPSIGQLALRAWLEAAAQ